LHEHAKTAGRVFVPEDMKVSKNTAQKLKQELVFSTDHIFLATDLPSISEMLAQAGTAGNPARQVRSTAPVRNGRTVTLSDLNITLVSRSIK